MRVVLQSDPGSGKSTALRCVTRFGRYYGADSTRMPSRHNLVTGRFGIGSGVVTHGGPASTTHMPEQMHDGSKPQNQLLQRVLRGHGTDTIAFTNFARRHYATWFSFGWTEFHSPTPEAGNEQAHEVPSYVPDPARAHPLPLCRPAAR